ncbi:hypothetical protein HX071_00355 [Myroides marinus]|uniref:DUF5689 domain-containing protein n=1 Tax=Myroides marinus TaxID=703342 RepID=A0A1H6SCM0_9FLAO|nr:DUF5689 domain-containing protein [Myroides marinus]KUF44975.1 hypothetical protein AS361_09285 [Myroides marinus]MDM1360180.1 hypothetical protein [Myroides marinus]MDM1404381.1 hypothetical protein [Myroides marinus]MDM1500655.1 hypothetical protein [Myroides marinus]SEI61505.1 hypothetical protein SAMN04488018_102253 [Myroides marinus]
MKTIFKSLLYFSFAGLILTGCAKNDDFSVPPINCEEPNIAANQTIDGLYSTIKEDSKVVAKYTNDEVISGIVVSSDQAGNFHQQLYIVDENTQTPVTLKVDIKGGFALYPVGSKVFVKLKDTYIHHSFGMITVGGGIYTSTSGNKYADVITGSKLRNTLYRSCKIKTGDEFNKYINVVTLEQLKADKTLLGKLIRVNEVQFERAVVGKTYYDKDDKASNDAQGQTLRKIVDKKGNSLVVRTGQYSNGIKDQIIVKESGSITGIVSDFQGTLQFYPRTMEDMKLDQAPFDEGNGAVDEDGSYDDPNMKLEPGKYLAFPGSNFEKWEDFTSVVNSYGLKHVALAEKQGWNGTNGMSLKATPTGNDFLFTIEKVKNVPTGATKISFLVKGKATGGSLVPLVYKANGKDYVAYNVKNLTVHKVVKANTKALGNNTTPVYDGTIDTKGEWVKVVLDLTSAPEGAGYNTSGAGNFFAIKVKKEIAYDLIIDEIKFEDGTPGDGTGPEVPEGDLSEAKGLNEDFEKEFTKDDRASSYDVKDLEFPIGIWSFSDGGVYGEANDLKASGKQSVRLRGNDKAEGFIQTKFFVTGLKKVELQFGGTKFSEATDADKEFAVEVFYSVDNGKTWKSAGKKVGVKEALTSATFDIASKSTDKVIVKIQNASFTRSTKNRLRINIDDVKFIK